jgi:hypothetical protein
MSEDLPHCFCIHLPHTTQCPDTYHEDRQCCWCGLRVQALFTSTRVQGHGLYRGLQSIFHTPQEGEPCPTR